MNIIPVIDLQAGRVVHGKAGHRTNYQSIQSKLTDDSSIPSIAQAFAAMNFSQCYVADLDAIASSLPNWQAYTQIANQGLALWIDAGINSLEKSRQMLRFIEQCKRPVSVIIGLETLTDIAQLESIMNLFGKQNIIFSLDLHQSRPITSIEKWKTYSANQIVQEVIALSVSRLIVLDLAQVGGNQGSCTIELCRNIKNEFPLIEITTGGGIRNLTDLKQMASAACDAVLLATALHNQQITTDDIEAIKQYRR